MNKKFVFTNENGDQYPAWEQQKLGDFLSKYTDTTIYVEDEKSYSQLTVSKKTGVSKRGDIQGSQIGRKRQFVVDTNKYPNTLTFTRQTVMDGGIGFIGPELNGFIATENMPLLSLDVSKCKKEYLNQYIGSDSYYEKVIFPIKPTGSAQIALHEKDWLAQIIPFPSLIEQEKVAEFFSALDERVALTADKVKLLKEQKTGYLQRIIMSKQFYFTDDNGDKYPEWEQKTLGEITTFIKDGSHGTHADDPEGVFLLSAKNVKNNRINYDDTDRKISVADCDKLYKNYQLQEKDLLLTVVGTIGRVALVPENFPKIAFQRSVAVLRFEKYVDPSFMLQLFTKDEFQAQLVRSQVVSAQPGIYLNDIAKLKVALPSLPEQEKIAEFFSALDEQIELTENKLALLKEQKKGYLQGIFG